MRQAKALIALLCVVFLAPTVEARRVQIAVATLSQSVLPLVVAKEKGYFREEDLEVELILTTASVANMSLLGGNVDFISSGSSAMVAISRGAPLKFIFIGFNRPMHWLYAKPEIKDVKGLKAKKIGVSAVGSSLHFLVLEILKRYGLESTRAVTVLGVGTTANRYAALQSGTIDATNLTPPYNFKAQEAGLRELVAFVKEDYLVDLAGTIVVRESLFQSDPAVIEKLIRGMLKGLFHIRQSRSSTIPILAKLMKTQDNVAEKIYDMVLPGLTTDGSLNPEVQKRVIDFVSRVQGIQEPVTAEKVFDFSSVRRIRADLEIKKWKPIS